MDAFRIYFYYNLAAFYYVALSLAVVVAGAYCSRRAEPPEQRKPRSVNLRSNVATLQFSGRTASRDVPLCIATVLSNRCSGTDIRGVAACLCGVATGPR
jgi:hypothetical protein